MQIKKNKAFSLSKSRKGVIATPWEELTGALLALIVITGIAYVALNLSGIFLSKKDYDSTIKSFDILGQKIDDLIKDKNYASTDFLYFIDKSYILVGFNYKDTSVQIKTCDGTFFKGESLSQSRKALGSLCEGACMCIYKNTPGNNFDKDLQIPLKCKTFDKNVVFLAPAEQKNVFCSIESGWHPQVYSDYYPLGNYLFLIMYGSNTQDIYIDKYESQDDKNKDDTTFIFLGKYSNDKNDPIYKRKAFMEDKYEKTSQADNQK